MQMLAYPCDDTAYEADALGLDKAVRSRGVFAADDCLSLAAAGGMAVTLSPGICNLKMDEYWGITARLKAAWTVTLDASDGVLSRYDIIRARLDKATQIAECEVFKGTPSSSPSIPTVPQRDANADDIYLHAVYVGAGAVEITAANITDLRLDTTVCGLVRDDIERIPTEQLQAQASAKIEQLQGAIDATISGAAPNGFYNYTCATTGTVHTLTALSAVGSNILFTADAAFAEGDTFTVDGVAATAKMQDGEALSDGYFVAGAVVQCFLSRTVLNFRQAGGAGLNVTVVAVTSAEELPANPKENTIAVVTDVPITGYFFAGTASSVWMSDGCVSLQQRDTSAATAAGTQLALVDKPYKMGVMAYPTNCIQIVGGAQVEKAFYVYRDGAWHSPILPNYYNAGVQNVAWEGSPQVSGYGTYFEADNIRLDRGYGGFTSYAYTAQKVDLTNISVLYATIDTTSCTDGVNWRGHSYFGVSNAKNYNTAINDTALNVGRVAIAPGAYQNYGIDVSALTGEYYIGVQYGGFNINTGVVLRVRRVFNNFGA